VPSADDRRVSSLPSVRARLVAFLAILVSGVIGAVIGYGFVDLQCDGDCATPDGIGALVGGLIAAVGVAIVSVLALRAMGEWRRIRAEQDAARNN
jgi:hypothetical protein